MAPAAEELYILMSVSVSNNTFTPSFHSQQNSCLTRARTFDLLLQINGWDECPKIGHRKAASVTVHR